MVRPMEEDLGLPPGSYFPEEELPVIPNAGESPRYPGLTRQWYLYPVVVSLTGEGLAGLEKSIADDKSALRSLCPTWWSLDEVLKRAKEPNVLAIASYLRDKRPEAALPLLTDLARDYPDNPLLRREAGRARKLVEARAGTRP